MEPNHAETRVKLETKKQGRKETKKKSGVKAPQSKKNSMELIAWD
jgi:hypothetical protein